MLPAPDLRLVGIGTSDRNRPYALLRTDAFSLVLTAHSSTCKALPETPQTTAAEALTGAVVGVIKEKLTCPVCRTSSYVRAPNKFSFLGQVGHWIVSGTGGR